MLPKLGFSLQKQYDRPINEVISLLKQVGFSAVSPIFAPEVDLSQISACTRALGMEIQSLHAPNRVAPLWSEDTQASAPIFEAVTQCIDRCAEYEIPVAVVHSWQGLSYTFPGEPLHYENFDRLVTYAESRQISIAFENLEGEEYLDALMARYQACSHVGFCWDSGHENCYPHKLDFLEKFGDRLIMTHLNDNQGPRDPSGVPTGVDDLHYLPWDGSIDWKNNLQKLKKARRQETLNFELKIRSISKAKQDLIYTKLTLEEYLQTAAARARRLAEIYASFPERKQMRL